MLHARSVLSNKRMFRKKDAVKSNGSKYVIHEESLVTHTIPHIQGINFYRMFSLAVKLAIFRLFLAIGAKESFELHWMEVKTAFC